MIGFLIGLLVSFGGAWWLDSQITRVPDLQLADPGVLPPDPFADVTEAPVDDPATVDDPGPDVIGEAVRAYLVYSTGSAGMTAEEAERFGVADLGRRGEDGLTDVMMVVMVDQATRQVGMLSIPRDLWVPELGMRINTVHHAHGPQAMVDTVVDLTGLPVNHLIEVNFTAFGELVEVLDGVPVQVDVPLRDHFSGLWLPEPGCVLLDPLTALGYVRSRHTESQRTNGGWGTAELGDFARTERQRQFLAAAWDDMRGPGLLTKVPRLFGVMTRNVAVDVGFGPSQVRVLAEAFRELSGGAVESYLLPGSLGRAGAASVVRLDSDAAQPILTRLRNWPPGPGEVATGTTNDEALAAAHGAEGEGVAGTDGTPPTGPDSADLATPAPAGDPVAAPCTREVATPAPGTPPPGRPPAYILALAEGRDPNAPTAVAAAGPSPAEPVTPDPTATPTPSPSPSGTPAPPEPEGPADPESEAPEPQESATLDATADGQPAPAPSESTAPPPPADLPADMAAEGPGEADPVDGDPA